MNKRREGPNTLATLSASVPPPPLDDGRRPPTAGARPEPCLLSSRGAPLLVLVVLPPPARRTQSRAPAPVSDGAPRSLRACAAAAPLSPPRAGTGRAAARVRPSQGRPRPIRRLRPPRLGLLTSGDPHLPRIIRWSARIPAVLRFYQSQCSRAQFLTMSCRVLSAGLIFMSRFQVCSSAYHRLHEIRPKVIHFLCIRASVVPDMPSSACCQIVETWRTMNGKLVI